MYSRQLVKQGASEKETPLIALKSPAEEVMLNRNPVSRTAYYVSLTLFAATPLIISRRRNGGAMVGFGPVKADQSDIVSANVCFLSKPCSFLLISTSSSKVGKGGTCNAKLLARASRLPLS